MIEFVSYFELLKHDVEKAETLEELKQTMIVLLEALAKCRLD